MVVEFVQKCFHYFFTRLCHLGVKQIIGKILGEAGQNIAFDSSNFSQVNSYYQLGSFSHERYFKFNCCLYLVIVLIF